jgi:hypothetical protein
MTEAEQKEVKALIERTVSESAKVVAQFEAKVAQLESEVERKNKALEGYIAENEALKEELGGRKPEPAAAPRETAAATIERWKTLAQKK